MWPEQSTPAPKALKCHCVYERNIATQFCEDSIYVQVKCKEHMLSHKYVHVKQPSPPVSDHMPRYLKKCK